MKSQSHILRTYWILSILLAISFPVYAVDGQIKIAQTPSTIFPISITQPGSYVLTNNIVSPQTTAIIIEVDNVTLDLNGYSITGPGKDKVGTGIFANGRHNLVIKNGTVQNFGKDGIALQSGGSTFELLNNRITNVNVFGNGGFGIVTWGVVSITNSVAADNGAMGIVASMRGSITNCVASGNGLGGIGVDSGIITTSIATYNGGTGISAQDATISDSTAEGNHVGYSLISSNLTNCIAKGNNGIGIDASTSNVSYSTTVDNGGHGVRARAGTRIEGVNARSNNGYGFYLEDAENYAIKNRASYSGLGNFFVTTPGQNYMPTDLTAPDAANANIGW